MIILGIETSCDETALALLECTGDLKNPRFSVLAEELYSQIEIHKLYGGVFPMLAKREHGRNLIPLLKNLLQKAVVHKLSQTTSKQHSNILENVRMILAREPELEKDFADCIPKMEKPSIDMIAVTAGPGLEPALWVGINFAKALSAFWNIPILPTNHMEGHLFSVLVNKKGTAVSDFRFPIVALLVSGGHTELVLAHDWLSYKLIGTTRDDAVGEAFDKVARILGLPYPGGPGISRLAAEAREKKYPNTFDLPRPMLQSKNFDFSYSGLKTSVLYQSQKLGTLSHAQKASIAREFEDAAIDVLINKTRRAMDQFGGKTLIAAGGVIANAYLRQRLAVLIKEFPEATLLLPDIKLSTDNAVMIATAAYIRFSAGVKPKNLLEMEEIRAHGTMRLA